MARVRSAESFSYSANPQPCSAACLVARYDSWRLKKFEPQKLIKINIESENALVTYFQFIIQLFGRQSILVILVEHAAKDKKHAQQTRSFKKQDSDVSLTL